MRWRWIVLCALTAVVSAAVPATAGACVSVAHVTSFSGIAHMAFDATASGTDPGEGGTETIALSRDLANVDIHLTKRKIIHNKITGTNAIFLGKATGGGVTIDDTFANTGTQASGHLSYDGPLINRLPGFGSASLFLNLNTCRYQFEVAFGVKAAFSGDPLADPGGTSVTGAFYGQRESIPSSLRIGDAAAPKAYGNCPGNPLVTGTACATFGGGWTNDFLTLFECHSVVAENCSSSDPSVAVATFAWHLKPKFSKP